jgi:hypothetical protein
MPVILKGDIRWSEQTDPKSFDYVKDWPEKLYAQGGQSFSTKFPVARENAPKNYERSN